MQQRRTGSARLRLALIAPALLTVGALAACGSSNNTATTGTTPAPSVSAGTSTGATPALAPGASVGNTQLASLLKNATAGLTSAHTTMTMNLNTAGVITVSGDLSFNPLAEDLTMQVSGETLQARLVGGQFYLNEPGGGWFILSSSELKTMGLSGLSSALANPLGTVSSTLSAVTSAVYIGSDATGAHYQLTIDTSKEASGLGVSAAPGASSSAAPTKVTDDVWFDSAGHMVRAKIDMGASGTANISFSQFNEKVDITAPTGAKDFSQLTGGVGGAGGKA